MRFYSTAVIMLFLVVGSCRVWAAGQGFVQTGFTNHVYSADGSLSGSQWGSFSFDKWGNAISGLTTMSNYNGLVPHSLTTVSNTFDKGGELLNSTELVDLDIDGIIDRRTSVTYIRLSDTQVREITATDVDNDGVIDESATSTQTFDKEGRIIYAVEEQIYHMVFQRYTNVYSWTYAEDKDKLVTGSKADYDGDGIVDVVGTQTELKNHRGQITSYSVNYDSDIWNFHITFQGEISYDKRGNRELVSTLLGDTGEPLDRSVITYSYASQGAVRQQSRAENQILDVMRQRLRGWAQSSHVSRFHVSRGPGKLEELKKPGV